MKNHEYSAAILFVTNLDEWKLAQIDFFQQMSSLFFANIHYNSLRARTLLTWQAILRPGKSVSHVEKCGWRFIYELTISHLRFIIRNAFSKISGENQSLACLVQQCQPRVRDVIRFTDGVSKPVQCASDLMKIKM